MRSLFFFNKIDKEGGNIIMSAAFLKEADMMKSAEKNKEIDDLNFDIAESHITLAEIYLSKTLARITDKSAQTDLLNEANQNLNFAADLILRSSGARWDKLNEKLKRQVGTCKERIAYWKKETNA